MANLHTLPYSPFIFAAQLINAVLAFRPNYNSQYSLIN